MIDAHLSLDGLTGPASPAARIVQGERQASDVAGRPLVGRKAGIGVIVAGAGIACGAILLGSTHPTVDPHDAAPKPAIMAQQTYVAPLRVPEPAKPLPPDPDPQPLMPRDQPTAIDPPTESRAASKLLVYSAGGNTGAGGMRGYGPSSPDPEPGSGDSHVVEGLDGSSLVAPGSPRDGLRSGRGDDLGSRLTPTRLTGVSASVLRHQPYLLTTGTMIPCILQTAMDSTLPGLVTCVVPQDIMGKTGLTLLDRGTRIVGEFRGGVRQGVERMFVVWARAETPQGVVIALDSPATDPLGRSGMDGDVDRHFWERFGGALLMTTVDGAIQAGVAQASQAGTVTVNTGSTETVIDDALRGSVDLPPTIRKNQGELVSILVARDLDFASVYRVRPTPGMGR